MDGILGGTRPDPLSPRINRLYSSMVMVIMYSMLSFGLFSSLGLVYLLVLGSQLISFLSSFLKGDITSEEKPLLIFGLLASPLVSILSKSKLFWLLVLLLFVKLGFRIVITSNYLRG